MRLFALLFHDNLTYITNRFKSTQIKAIQFKGFLLNTETHGVLLLKISNFKQQYIKLNKISKDTYLVQERRVRQVQHARQTN